MTSAFETNEDPRTPVTLLTGFLGAGKTTLLNRILSDASTGQIAVIINEFGEAALDHDLIETIEDEVVLMKSGCLCCSIRGDLSETMANLIARRKAGDIQFDRVVIETTGLAEPGPILHTLLVDPKLACNARLDGVVTIFDAANGPATLDAQFEAVSQVAMADLLLISKTDLVTQAQVESLSARLRNLNPTASIALANSETFEASQLWGITALREGATRKDAIVWTTSAPTANPLANLSGLTPQTKTTLGFSPHDKRITSMSIVLDHPLNDNVFDLWLDTLIRLKGPDILRVKGIVFLHGLDAPFVFHGVQHIFDPPVQLKTWNSDDRRSRIVVIGRDLTRPELQTSFDMLRAGQPDTQPHELETLGHD